jgi:hypothetical protein
MEDNYFGGEVNHLQEYYLSHMYHVCMIHSCYSTIFSILMMPRLCNCISISLCLLSFTSSILDLNFLSDFFECCKKGLGQNIISQLEAANRLLIIRILHKALGGQNGSRRVVLPSEAQTEYSRATWPESSENAAQAWRAGHEVVLCILRVHVVLPQPLARLVTDERRAVISQVSEAGDASLGNGGKFAHACHPTARGVVVDVLHNIWDSFAVARMSLCVRASQHIAQKRYSILVSRARTRSGGVVEEFATAVGGHAEVADFAGDWMAGTLVVKPTSLHDISCGLATHWG